MKKLFYFAAAAVVLAACAKNEVIPVNSGENQEITFNVAPKTKADPEPKKDAFSTDKVFASWAYYLPNTEGMSWDKNRTGAKIYIGKEGDAGVTISHDDVNNVWKNSGVSYYWPKDGKLTFFAYSLNRGDLKLKHSEGHSYPIVCHNSENAYGINAIIDLSENPNFDLLVAEIAADKTHNEDFHNLNGVPTLFKHKFSRVQFAVKKKENYNGVSIKLNSITFNKVVSVGTYCQYNREDGKKTFTKDYYKEGDVRSSAVYTTSVFEVDSKDAFKLVPETTETKYIYMPQNFSGVEEADKIATIAVTYTVTYKDGISETYNRTINVKEIFGSWEMGKKYTFNLIFSLNEITWAPVVEDWESVTPATDRIVE